MEDEGCHLVPWAAAPVLVCPPSTPRCLGAEPLLAEGSIRQVSVSWSQTPF